MGSFSREELWVSQQPKDGEEEEERQRLYVGSFPEPEDPSEETSHQKPKPKKKKKKKQVLLEGYVVEATSEEDLKRTKSLTDEDLDELKGCLDLGFGFSYDEIPELCNTLPALELCYSMSQRFRDDQSPDRSSSPESACPIANWKISSPGDHPEDVKARLKYWAQAVACTVRLCS